MNSTTYNPLQSAFKELTNDNARKFYSHQAIQFALTIFSFSCAAYEAGQTARKLYEAYLQFIGSFVKVPQLSVPRLHAAKPELPPAAPQANYPAAPMEVAPLQISPTFPTAPAKSPTVKELRKIAKDAGIAKTSKMTKSQLIDALQKV